MSQIIETLKEDIKTAMKARDREQLTTLRMLHSSLNNEAIELRRELEDEEAIEVLAREMKKRQQSAEAFEQGGRPELAEKERQEIETIQKYLPTPYTDEEVAAIVDEVIVKTGAQGRRDMGKVMGQVIPRVKGRYDASKIKDIVLDKLS